MASIDTILERFQNRAKYQALYAQCLVETPLQKDIPRSRPKAPPAPLIPKSFDELFVARKDLQAGKLTLVREPIMQNWYEYVNAGFELYQKEHPDQWHPFKSEMRRALDEKGVSFRQNDYPYQLSEDINSHILWYRRGFSRQARARVLAGMFLLEGLELDDFVIYRNPTYKRTVPEFPHDHIFTRRKPDGFTFNTIPTHVEI